MNAPTDDQMEQLLMKLDSYLADMNHSTRQDQRTAPPGELSSFPEPAKPTCPPSLKVPRDPSMDRSLQAKSAFMNQFSENVDRGRPRKPRRATAASQSADLHRGAVTHSDEGRATSSSSPPPPRYNGQKTGTTRVTGTRGSRKDPVNRQGSGGFRNNAEINRPNSPGCHKPRVVIHFSNFRDAHTWSCDKAPGGDDHRDLVG